jgi:hypothetical protein
MAAGRRGVLEIWNGLARRLGNNAAVLEQVEVEPVMARLRT